MRSAWAERDAKLAVDRYSKDGIDADLALRIYSTQLLGRDTKLVMHGGGNSSLKTREHDIAGEELAVLRVKGSGWDMGIIEPAGFPAVRLDPLLKLRARAALDDDEFARVQRAYLIDPQAPSPSVEMLLHAFVPAKFVDHTHATAVLSLIDQPASEELCAETFGGRLGFVPYIMPGFSLAKKSAEIFEQNPKAEGLILDKHGIFTSGADARQAYERMIEFVTLAESRIQNSRKTFASANIPSQIAPISSVAPILRGACTLRDAAGEGAHTRPILEFRTGDAILNYVNGADTARYTRAGVLTPDHVLRTKPWPLLLPPPQAGKLDDFKLAAQQAAKKFIDDYGAYFDRNKARTKGAMLDPVPRVALVPGLGLFGMGASAKDARIAADIAETAVEGITDAEALGRYTPVGEADMFDLEYWPMELAKLGARKPLALEGQVAVITGGGGVIGAATAKVFAQTGAQVALLDIDAKAAAEQAKAIGGAAIAIQCDVTDAISVGAAFSQVTQAFGGVDIAISNAGAAWQGKIGEVDEATLRESFELNFFGHQKVAQAAVKIMLAQGIGGCLLFNVSKQAVNPGANFGPYGLPKAATLFLVRQYALDYGTDGIRANAV
ncbi:MAG: bifunctional aldolase/short-chain dehydrogenase, partial [Pseudolabrys sp.]